MQGIPRTSVFLLECLASGLFLWLGLYILTRELAWSNRKAKAWPRPALPGAVGLMLLSWFLLGMAVGTVSMTREEAIFWRRLTWWTVPIAVALWFWMVLLLTAPDSVVGGRIGTWRKVAILFAGLYALLLAAGTFTDLLVSYQNTYYRETPFGNFHIPAQPPLYHGYGAFIVGIPGLCAVLLLRRYWQAKGNPAQRGQFRWLSIGGIVSLCGALLGVWGYFYLEAYLPQRAGAFLSTIGLGCVGYGIANYNALLHNRVTKYDFVQSLLGVAAAAGFYLLLFGAVHCMTGYPLSPLAVSLLVWLAVLAHTPGEWFRWLLDSLTLPGWEVKYREQLIRLRRELLLAPDPQRALSMAEEGVSTIAQQAQGSRIRTLIRDEIHRIFRYKEFWHDAVLVDSRLFDLEVVRNELEGFLQERHLTPEALTRRDRAQILRGLLMQLLESQLGSGREPRLVEPATPAQVGCLILWKRYVEDKQRNEVEHEIEREVGALITGGTYSRCLERGRRRLATLLWQTEMRARTG